MSKQTSQFDTLWQKAQSEPRVQKIKATRIEANVSIQYLMDRYLESAREAVSQNKLSREALEQLTNHTKNYKSALTQLESAGIGVIGGLRRRLRDRLLDWSS